MTTASGWFAARPSGTENICKIYAESFEDERHLAAIVDEARQIVEPRMELRHDRVLPGGRRQTMTGERCRPRRRSSLHALLVASPRQGFQWTDKPMNALRHLHDLGQSLWLDNITRDLLTSGTLKRYIDELTVTGLTSNPTIFEQRDRRTVPATTTTIRKKLSEGKIGRRAVLRTGHRRHHRGRRPVPAESTIERAAWTASSRWRFRPLLAHDTADYDRRRQGCTSAPAARTCSSRYRAPGEGLPAIEEAIFAGVPVNVTLLFSREHYLAAADAYLRGIERRIAAGLKPDVASVASLFVSRWDVAVSAKVPERLRNRLGIAIGKRAYKAYADLIASPRFQRLLNAGARPQRLLMASTGTKDPTAPDILYVEGAGRAATR